MRVALLLLFVSINGCFADQVSDFDREQIIERIKPVGQVKIEDATPATEQKKVTEPTAQVAAKEEPGQAIYERYCSSCHQNGLAGAPKFRQAADWKPRMAKKIEGLTASAIKGLNAMPPKGTCAECSEEDIKTAIQYMLPKS
ncbi:cytochrome c5 [Legionella beliardensis]|uniref:Cytochrome c5 n=2 Tax=Legionella beliardensis TaxID=91822 RepID=A0A378I555_9GAMM|nr:cytochrome c5 [Legionella beliardensis]